MVENLTEGPRYSKRRCGYCLTCGVSCLTNGAIQADPPICGKPLQNTLRPFVKAGLTEVVDGLWSGWIAIASSWSIVESVHKNASGELEKRIASALLQCSLKLGELITISCHLGLQLKELPHIDEQILLRLEELVVNRGNQSGGVVEISNREHCLGSVFGCLQAACDARDKGDVHDP